MSFRPRRDVQELEVLSGQRRESPAPSGWRPERCGQEADPDPPPVQMPRRGRSPPGRVGPTSSTRPAVTTRFSRCAARQLYALPAQFGGANGE